MVLNSLRNLSVFCCGCLVLLIVCCQLNGAAEQQRVVMPTKQKLRFVQAIWRHGDRALHKKAYPDAPHGLFLLNTIVCFWDFGNEKLNFSSDEDNWRRGWGQLTEIGMQQAEELGNNIFFYLTTQKK